MKKLLRALRIIFQEPLYVQTALGSTLAAGYLSYWLFTRTTTLQIFLANMQNGDFGPYSMVYGVAYLLTTVLIIFFSGISIAVALWLFRHSKAGTGKSIGANAGSLIAAAFGMGCPVCGAFLFSLLGIAGGLSTLPLQGLELKLFSLGLLAASIVYGASKVTADDCASCRDFRQYRKAGGHHGAVAEISLEKILVLGLAGLFLFNQVMIANVTTSFGLMPANAGIAGFFSIRRADAYMIVAPKLNPDGKTTSLVEQPTITEVPANPNTGDALADAKFVMTPTGKPFYAPSDIAFDDPINAQNKWGVYEGTITLPSNLETRYQSLISTMTCGYCCGSPTRVTRNKECGCAHAKAARGFFKYMLQTYGETYSDEQLIGEAFRWWAIWYPKGMLEDYLLATGKGEVLPHQTHGGAGADGRHGLSG